MPHSTTLQSNLRQNVFYKAPVPLLFGNLPFGDNFKEHRHEYHYVDYYVVPQVPAIFNRMGVLFYSEFFKKYILVATINTTYSHMFPSLSDKEGTYYLNPFVNDENGACCWIRANLSYANTSDYIAHDSQPGGDTSKIYYNFSKDRYEHGFGEYVWSYNDCYFPIYMKNNNNGYYTQTDDAMSITSVINSSNSSVSITSVSQLRDLPLDYKINRRPIGYIRGFRVNSNYPNFDLSNLSADGNITMGRFDSYVLSENAYPVNYTCSMYMLGSQNSTAWLVRSTLLKDLDHELNPEIPEMVGIYETNFYHPTSTGTQNLIGSFVIGDEAHKDDVGWFIGVNSTYYVTSSSSHGVRQIKVPCLTNRYYYTRKTSYDVSTDLVHGVGRRDSINQRDEIHVIGVSWKSEVPKFLVFLVTAYSEGVIQKYRLYISEGSPYAFYTAKKLWYADLPGEDSKPTSYYTSPPGLFKYPFSNISPKSPSTFTELTFNYINLEDENDTKEPVNFTILGATRENPLEKILACPIEPTLLFTQTKATRINTYIGYWDTPIVNFEEEQNEEN